VELAARLGVPASTVYRDLTVEVTGSAGDPSSRDAAPPPCR
jgi:hypothetical protein